MDKLGMLTALRAEHTLLKVGHSMWQPLQNIFDCRNLPK